MNYLLLLESMGLMTFFKDVRVGAGFSDLGDWNMILGFRVKTQ